MCHLDATLRWSIQSNAILQWATIKPYPRLKVVKALCIGGQRKPGKQEKPQEGAYQGASPDLRLSCCSTILA